MDNIDYDNLDYKIEYLDTVEKLKCFEDKKLLGAKIRAKIKDNLDYETPDKIFYKLENKHNLKSSIFLLKQDDGHTLTQQPDIINEIYQFYQNVWGQTNITQIIANRTNSSNV